MAVAATLAVIAVAACNSPSVGHAASSSPTAASASRSAATVSAKHHRGMTRHALLHSKRKYYGVFVPSAPDTLTRYQQVGQQVHKRPQLVGFFRDWTHPFPVDGARRVCQLGATPSLTWESWSWEDVQNGSPAFSQPRYAPRRIARGFDGKYVRQFARQIRSVHCTVMLRFDHEMNGYWYPWGRTAKGMHNKPADYIAMWRHVWRVFHRMHVHNVIWVWCPNFVRAHGTNPFGAMYPGNKYVDMVGVDGYLFGPGDTPKSLFGWSLRRLHKLAPHRPALIAETGAPNDSKQPARIRLLLRAVARYKRVIGFSYFDESGSRANWTFNYEPASVAAFRQGIARHIYRGAHR